LATNDLRCWETVISTVDGRYYFSFSAKKSAVYTPRLEARQPSTISMTIYQSCRLILVAQRPPFPLQNREADERGRKREREREREREI